MFKKFFGRSKQRILVVKFEGGMGSQIFQVALLKHLISLGISCVGDFSYFDKKPVLATVGTKGMVSQWGWSLDSFNVTISDLPNLINFKFQDDIKMQSISEIYSKQELARLTYQAILSPAVRDLFSTLADVHEYISPSNLNSSVCCHIRRGDYINVSSHLVHNDEFYEAAEITRSLSKTLIVVSDSSIDKSISDRFAEFYESVSVFDNLPTVICHSVMRQAKGLICSNSTFSLSAALLGTSQLVLFPKRWYSGGDAELINSVIGELSNWQVLTRRPHFL